LGSEHDAPHRPRIYGWQLAIKRPIPTWRDGHWQNRFLTSIAPIDFSIKNLVFKKDQVFLFLKKLQTNGMSKPY
jgi:hypothetical protein